MMGGMGIFEFPAMIEPDGSMGNLIVAVVGVVITMVIAFAATMIFYKDDKETAKVTAAEQNSDTGAVGGNSKDRVSGAVVSEEKQVGTEEDTEGDTEGDTDKEAAANRVESAHKGLFNQMEIVSPMKGKVIAQASMKDDAFASGVLGKGAAVLPEEGRVYAPADGVISTLFPTLHAIGIEADGGAELLIHVGLDTVQLNGEGFKAMIAQGDRVKKGQLLLTFDKELIESRGYCLETPVLVTNSDDFLDVVETGAQEIMPGDMLLKVLK